MEDENAVFAKFRTESGNSEAYRVSGLKHCRGMLHTVNYTNIIHIKVHIHLNILNLQF